ncbi:Hypothetical predicted protein [Paramuricea clavata]|nr:Hypothetical predicted protein [Paramuricea clavata]
MSKTVHETEQNNEEKESLKRKSVGNPQIMGDRPKPAINYEKAYEEICKNSWEKDYTKFHQHLLETNRNKFILYDCPGRGGWGSQIRNLLGSFQFAVISKRAFINECNKPIDFDTYLKPRHIKWNHKVNQTGLTVRRSFSFKREDIKNFSDAKPYEEMLTYDIEYTPRFMSISHLVLPNLIRYNHAKSSVFPFVMNGCNFYYLFKKSDPLQKRLDEWKGELGFNDNIVLAIHIRHGDAIFSGHFNQWDVRINGSKDYDLCFECAEQIEKKIGEKYHTKKIIWFLAVDIDWMRTYAKKKYGNKVRHISGPIEHVGRSTKGKEDAGQFTMFLDYFLLQESDYRLYTSESSFDTAVDYITFGKNNAGRVHLEKDKRTCSFPSTLLH